MGYAYEDILNIFKLTTLETIRLELVRDLIEVFKMFKGFDTIGPSMVFFN